MAERSSPVTKVSRRMFDQRPNLSKGVPKDKMETFYGLLWEDRARFDIEESETSQIIAFKR